MQLKSIVFLSFLFALCLASCKEDSSEANVTIQLTDGPAEYEAVLLDLEGVEVHIGNDTAGNNGWHTLTIQPGIVDLLVLANGLDTAIGQGSLPAGKLTQIRLLLGSNNAVKVDGVSYPLDIKTEDKESLKLKINQEIVAGENYTFLLDFDAGKSIKETGNNNFKLKPVIKLVNATTSGVIKGYIDPAGCRSYLSAESSVGTASTFTHKNSGYFFLQGLVPGTYSLFIDAKYPCQDTTIQNIVVSAGNAVDLGKIKR